MIVSKIGVFRCCYFTLQFCLIFWVLFRARNFNEVQYWVCLLSCSCKHMECMSIKATVHFYTVIHAVVFSPGNYIIISVLRKLQWAYV